MTEFAALFEKHFGLEHGSYDPEMTYNTVDGWDSLAHMAIVAEMEDAHGVEFEVDEISEMTSAGKMYEILMKRKEG